MWRVSYGKPGVRAASVLLFATVLAAGCANNGANYPPGAQNENQAVRNQATHNQGLGQGRGQQVGMNTRTLDRDDLMGRNQNPNLIIGHANTRNYQVDMNNMVMMAKSVPGVENCRITLNGPNAYVTLDLKHNVTASEARNIEREVIAALRQKIPRYDFHVTSNDSYHR
ncbi:sporulation protein [Brevibacillus sp. TJ4]|uniref:sporulation protein n=1 Tax=Brevibacillus sp. TJ4 TaxID=3234853 RepID=UPI0037CFA907